MKDLRIALIQTILHWQDISANLQMLDKKIASIRDEVDLIILPETFSTGFSMEPEKLAESMDGAAVHWLRSTAQAKKCVVTGSLLLYEEKDGKKTYFNRLVWMKPEGGYEYYDKRHLFGLSQEYKLLEPGDKRLIVSIGGWRICPMICYDLRFPVWSRNAINDKREADYDVLIYVANWPSPRVLAWKTLLQARAIENQCYAVGVNRTGPDGDGMDHTGDSSVIGPLGDILYRRENDEDIAIIDLKYDELVKVRRTFPFLRDADRFELTGQ